MATTLCSQKCGEMTAWGEAYPKDRSFVRDTHITVPVSAAKEQVVWHHGTARWEEDRRCPAKCLRYPESAFRAGTAYLHGRVGHLP